MAAPVFGWYSPAVMAVRSRNWIGRSRMRRLVAIGAAAGLIAGVAASAGIGRSASYRTVRQARLAGDVLLCRVGGVACSAVSANVALSRMDDGVGRVVARQDARDGHFSFVVVPGQYVPTAKIVGPRAVRVQCLTSRVVVRSGENARVDVLCHSPRR
jgi:hypothetical protein